MKLPRKLWKYDVTNTLKKLFQTLELKTLAI